MPLDPTLDLDTASARRRDPGTVPPDAGAHATSDDVAALSALARACRGA